MVDLITLGVEVQTTGGAQATQGLGAFQKAAQGAAKSADVLEDNIRQLNATQVKGAAPAKGMAGAIGGIGAAFKNNSSAIQNASFQLQDVLVQMEMGVPITRTLGQQLPQLLGGFGGIGAVAGVAAGALFALIPILMDTTTETRTLKDATDELSDSIGALRDLSSEAASLDKLAEKYGAVDTQLVQLLGHMREQQIAAAQSAAADAIQILADEYKVATGAVNLFKITGTGAAADVAEELGLTKYAMLAFQAAIREAESATTFEQQADALAKIDDILSRSTISDGTFAQGITDAALKLRQIEAAAADSAAAVAKITALDPESGWLSGAISQAEALAKQLWSAVDATMQINIKTSSVKIGAGGRPDIPDNTESILEARIRIQRKQAADAEAAARAGRSGPKLSPAEQDAKRLFEGTRTEAEKYATELAKVNELYKSGAIDGDVYARSVAKLAEEFDPLAQLISDLSSSVENELNSAFASVLDGTKTLGEALLDFASNVLAKVAQDLFAQQFAAPIASGIKGLFSEDGNVFGPGGYVPFAKGGVVSGPTIFPFANGTGLMGEAGPEAIMPLSRGSDGKLGVAAANGNSAPKITINNYSGQEASTSSDNMGNIIVEIGRAIAQDITGGGPTYRAIKSTFGISNRLQQRG
jgi:phage-related minor tail protein